MQVMASHVIHEVDNEGTLQLSTGRAIAQGRGSLRTIGYQHIWAEGDSHGEISPRFIFPVMGQRFAALPAYVDLEEVTREGVKACGADYIVELPFFLSGFDSALCNLDDGC